MLAFHSVDRSPSIGVVFLLLQVYNQCGGSKQNDLLTKYI